MNSLYEVQTMKKTVEIRWHGRGGQGAKTAALLLADVAFKTGRCVQGFPEYGPRLTVLVKTRSACIPTFMIPTTLSLSMRRFFTPFM